MVHYLYRNSRRRAIAGLLSTLLFAPLALAQVLNRPHNQVPPADDNQTQINAKPKKRGPRAIAVLELLPGGSARLVPVALWIDDRYYDASLYGANPEPFALQPDTVYEATHYGEPTGFFTVQTPEQIKGSWIGDGRWKPRNAFSELKSKQPAQQAEANPAPLPADGRPTLRRPGDTSTSAASGNSGSGGSASSSSSGVKPIPDEPADRPTLKKSSPDTPTSSAASSAPPEQSSAPASQKPASVSESAAAETDPNRPLLRRGSQPQPATSTAAAADHSPAAMGTAQGQVTGTLPKLGRNSYPAVSDAGVYETRSLLYPLTSAEREEKSEQLRDLALDEIRKFASTRRAPPVPKTATITDYELRAFDLDYSNSPTLVLTATLPVEGAKSARGGEFDYYVTVVAHESVDNTPIKIFAMVSDSNHLDAYPRMDIIDAVDADANGRGDLLFRQYFDTSISYSLYRVYPYQMEKVFEGGSSL